jgi:hypothetical protein
MDKLGDSEFVRRVPSVHRSQPDSDVHAVKRSLPRTDHPEQGQNHGDAVRRENHGATSREAQTMAVVEPNGQILDDSIMSEHHISLLSNITQRPVFSSSVFPGSPAKVRNFAGSEPDIHSGLQNQPFSLRPSAMLDRPGSHTVQGLQLLVFVIGLFIGAYLARLAAAFLKRRGVPSFHDIFNSFTSYSPQRDVSETTALAEQGNRDPKTASGDVNDQLDASKLTKHRKANSTQPASSPNEGDMANVCLNPEPKGRDFIESGYSDSEKSECWSDSRIGSPSTCSEPEPLIDVSDGFGQLLQGGYLWKLKQAATKAITKQLIVPKSNVEIEYPDESKTIHSWNLRRFELQAGSDALKLMYVSEKVDMEAKVLIIDEKVGDVEQLATLHLSVCDDAKKKRDSVAQYKIGVQNRHELGPDVQVPSILHTFIVTGTDDSGMTLRMVLGAASENVRERWMSALNAQIGTFRAAQKLRSRAEARDQRPSGMIV